MGTNYYARKSEYKTPSEAVCETCPYRERFIKCLEEAKLDEFHIGKSSWGWQFCFESNEQFQTYAQFLEWIKNRVITGEYVIVDEYERTVNPNDLIELIQSKRGEQSYSEDRVDPEGYRFSRYHDFS